MWDLVVLQNLETMREEFEDFVGLKESIVVFEQHSLENNDRLVRFEDVGADLCLDDELYMDQFPRVDGVTVRACRPVGKRELGLLEFSTK